VLAPPSLLAAAGHTRRIHLLCGQVRLCVATGGGGGLGCGLISILEYCVHDSVTSSRASNEPQLPGTCLCSDSGIVLCCCGCSHARTHAQDASARCEHPLQGCSSGGKHVWWLPVR
jgi:hypothetical protein